MNWSDYKDICDRTNVFSRWALDRTQNLLTPELSKELELGVVADAIPKPEDHKGDHRTDMFEVNLDVEIQQGIVAELSQQAGRESTQDLSAPKISPLLKAWEELLRDSQTT